MNPLKFVIMTDTHYYSKKNWIAGNYDDFPPANDQLLLKYSEEIIKHTFDELSRDGDTDIVLISGDLTNNAEIPSHEEMCDALRKLKASGKKVLVTTATHDYKTGYMPGYGFDENNQKVPVPQLEREKLLEYYGEFGYNDAVSVHEESMSYIAQLADGYRLLALNDDYGDPHCGFSDGCLEWIKEQAKKAHEDGQVFFAMTHHPLIAPSALYLIIGGDNILWQREMLIELFSDWGIPFVFTGHSHVQNISSVKTKSGKTFYDISTAALIGFPPVYRKVEISPNEKKMDIRTVWIDRVKGIATNGLTLTDYTKKLFLGSVSDAIENAVNDYEKFAEFAVGMSISKEVSYQYQFPIKKVAGFLNRLTFGKVWKLVRFSSGVSPSEINMVYHKKAVPFIIDVVANLYKGDADIEKDSVEYRITKALLEKLDKLSRPFSEKLGEIGIESFSSVILPLLHKEGIPDSDAVLHY